MSNLANKSDSEMREILEASRQTLTSLVEGLTNRPDMQNAIRRLMRPDDMLETFSELAVREPDLMRLVLQASVAALVNVQSVEAAGGEWELKPNRHIGWTVARHDSDRPGRRRHLPAASHQQPCHCDGWPSLVQTVEGPQ